MDSKKTFFILTIIEKLIYLNTPSNIVYAVRDFLYQQQHKASKSLTYYSSEDRARRSMLRRTFNDAKSPVSGTTWEDFYNIQREHKKKH